MATTVTSKRLGRQRPRRRFPVFIARPYLFSGFCGHQHSTKARAARCAENHEHRDRCRWVVMRVKKDGSEVQVDA